MFVTGVAYAMGGSPGGGAGGGLMGLLPILLMFVIFYFLLIRPQQKQASKQRDFIKNLKVGDRVVTTRSPALRFLMKSRCLPACFCCGRISRK